MRCPICSKPMPGQATEWPDYPFCSAKCRKIDLGRWLGEKYRVPADDQTKPEDESKEE
ncbi:MAG TPA: DNA gyrase inhibitor YacG [Gemmataceae bacterium]|nr:DNA gyrase inhibitor YacG [Gemmataceae bacterium]